MEDANYISYVLEARKIDDIIANTIIWQEYESLNEKLAEYSEKKGSSWVAAFSPTIRKTGIITVILLVLLSIINATMAVLFVISYKYGADISVIPSFLLPVIIFTLLINLAVVLSIVELRKRKARFETIKRSISSMRICYLTDIVALTKIQNKKIVSILRWAIKNGLIPNGKLVYNQQVLLTSNKLISYYMDNQQACDEYFMYIIDKKNEAEERPQKLSNYLDERSKDVAFIQRDFEKINDSVIQNELVEVKVKTQQLVFAADMDVDRGEYCYYLLDYYLMSSERLLRAYVQCGNNHTKDEINLAIDNVNAYYNACIISILS